MAGSDTTVGGTSFQDPAGTQKAKRSKISGYASLFSRPGYERLRTWEDFLRRMVPILIVIFLFVMAIARWVQINALGEQIVSANQSELSFIAELLEERISQRIDAAQTLPEASELQAILDETVPARYLIKQRQILLTDENEVVIASEPTNSGLLGTPIQSVLSDIHLMLMFGKNANVREVVNADGNAAIAIHRHLSGDLGGITIFQPKAPMMAAWRRTVSTNVSLFVGTSSILIVILYAYFSQIVRAKEADEIYQTTHDRYDKALKRGKCGLWDWDISRGRIYWSDSMFALLGMKREGASDSVILTFQEVSDLLHPKDTSLLSLTDLVLIEHADAIDKVFRMRHADGRWVWTRIRAQVTRSAQGEPHLIGIAIDVTEQETIRRRTRNTATRLHDAIENLSEAFVLWDDRKRLVMCNSKFQQLHGLNPDLALPGVTYEELMERTNNPLQGTEIMQGGRESGETRSYEVRLRDGRWLQFNERRTLDGGYVSVGNDITTIKLHEKQLMDSELRQKATITDLKKSRRQLLLQADQLEELAEKIAEEKERAEAASQAKSDFLANMSHELRTPLNAVIGFSEAMQAELFGKLGSEKYREYCRDIHDSGNFLLGVINDILDMSKIEAGRFTLDYEEIRIHDIIEETLRIISREAETKEITIHEKISNDLEIEADRRAVKQILLNLMSNAVKFSRKGGEIQVRARKFSNCLRITIEDKGIGISRQDLSKLGQPFEQAQNQMTRDHKGSGLGLAISKSLTHMHGGALKIRSRVGKGTIVSVQLPLERPETDLQTKKIEIEAEKAA